MSVTGSAVVKGTLIYEPENCLSGTAFGGTALIGDRLAGSEGNWFPGALEQAVLNEIAELPG
jgi:hypothetical protein